MKMGPNPNLQAEEDMGPTLNPNLQADEDMGLDNSKHGGSAYKHDDDNSKNGGNEVAVKLEAAAKASVSSP